MVQESSSSFENGLFKVNSKEYPKWYTYFWTKHHIDRFIQVAESKSTTIGHINRVDISNAKVLIPNEEQLSEMNRMASPLIERMVSNFGRLASLESTRDSLLPKLMNREVKVKDKTP